MNDYDEFALAHDRYMAHEDLYTKWANAAMVTQSILIVALSQMLIHRGTISDFIGEQNTRLTFIALSFAGMCFSVVWLLTDWRNFYYTQVRIDVIRKLEAQLLKTHKASKLSLHGFLNREFLAFEKLTSGSLSKAYRAHRKRWGRLSSAIGATASFVIIHRFSSRYRFIVIPIVFALIWLGLLLMSIRLAI